MSVQVTLLGKGLCTDVTLEWLVTNIVPVEVHRQVTVAKEGTRAELALKEPLACVNLKVSFQVAVTGKGVGAKVTPEPSLFTCVCQRPSCRRIGFFGDHALHSRFYCRLQSVPFSYVVCHVIAGDFECSELCWL